ncbi:MAG TPA: hypothetical protein V6C96_05725, partial [Vampirovibrionales bacterium]
YRDKASKVTDFMNQRQATQSVDSYLGSSLFDVASDTQTDLANSNNAPSSKSPLDMLNLFSKKI